MGCFGGVCVALGGVSAAEILQNTTKLGQRSTDPPDAPPPANTGRPALTVRQPIPVNRRSTLQAGARSTGTNGALSAGGLVDGQPRLPAEVMSNLASAKQVSVELMSNRPEYRSQPPRKA